VNAQVWYCPLEGGGSLPGNNFFQGMQL